ncbi:hypothetical protein Kisp01_20240 [Kineosporia sp. NBRC 101677]|uniref:hypothetical protein n=1 Tax=Kineosporia sp. NBRC 101677 TaxID=3032197 RepID=UPI0024A1D1AF|nr:hypothetical protein [Kineosporia sp. NBRC 101677]GLY15009.1 hypothetical protein Kisp01_20240 [Kineosporia sp. NBRC 101677]
MTSDDELREQLRGADPARSLPPLPAESVSALADRIMDEVPSPSRFRPPSRGRRVGWSAAAAGLAAAVVAGVVVNLSGESEPGVQAESPVTERVVLDGSGADSKCPAPEAAELRTVDVAVEATVRTISDGVVALAVSHVWAGPQFDVLEVEQTSGASESLLGGTSFTEGETYLVAAVDGQVRGCGYSGVASTELRSLYDEAF